jgi:trimethylamine--corrinoid protein Co-methyltransferase
MDPLGLMTGYEQGEAGVIIPYRHERATDFLRPGQAERVHALALQILEKVGLAVSHREILERATGSGIRVQEGRAHFAPWAVEEFLDGYRKAVRAGDRAVQAENPASELTLSVGVYAHHVHDLETDRIVPYTSEKLVMMTKLVDVLTQRGVRSPAPGYPLDVPPPLQPIAKYRIGALFSRHGAAPVDPISGASVPYVMEMAEVLGHPLRRLPVYVFSPLRLAGESLEVVWQYRDRLEGLSVSNMPSLGGTAPIAPFAALAMAAAEVLGASLVLSRATGLPVRFGIGLHAFDLRFGTMVFGSPEAYLLGQLNAEINEFYSGQRRERGQAAAGIHVRANFPGPQAAAEKAMLMTAGALIGARHFDGAGILAVDEVFSPEQLLIDVEIKDMVQRLLSGLDMSENTWDWLAEIQEGAQRGFIGLESTLQRYREAYWHPLLFERSFLDESDPAPRERILVRVRELVGRYIAQHEYELDAERRREIERIWKAAVQAFA